MNCFLVRKLDVSKTILVNLNLNDKIAFEIFNKVKDKVRKFNY